MAATFDDAAARRVLRALERGAATVAEGARSSQMLLDLGERGTLGVDRRVLARLLEAGILLLEGNRLSLAGGSDGPGAGKREIGIDLIDLGSGPQPVAVNWSESPLAQLRRRKDRNGEPFLSMAEFRAGERLRADYTRGRIMPRMSANWEASVSSGRRAGGVAELSDAAIAARLRVERAIAAVGPELAGVLIDACCFLKGMETVEMERGWPARSAKVVLKTALGALSRHYDPARPEGARQALHWGTPDFRPSL